MLPTSTDGLKLEAERDDELLLVEDFEAACNLARRGAKSLVALECRLTSNISSDTILPSSSDFEIHSDDTIHAPAENETIQTIN